MIVLSSDVTLDLSKPPFRDEGLSASVIGMKGSGKSNVLAVICEQVYKSGIPFIFFDVNGDAASLRELGSDVLVIGHEDPSMHELRQAHIRLNKAIAHAIRIVDLALSRGFSVVIDLSSLEEAELRAAFVKLGDAIFIRSGQLRSKEDGHPALVVIDEAHRFAPQETSKETKLSRKTFENLMNDGRKRGILLVLATQRSQLINKNVLHGCNLRMFGKIMHNPDYKAVQSYLPPNAIFHTVKNLATGRFYVMWGAESRTIQINLRETTDLGKTPEIKVDPNRVRGTADQALQALEI